MSRDDMRLQCMHLVASITPNHLPRLQHPHFSHACRYACRTAVWTILPGVPLPAPSPPETRAQKAQTHRVTGPARNARLFSMMGHGLNELLGSVGQQCIMVSKQPKGPGSYHHGSKERGTPYRPQGLSVHYHVRTHARTHARTRHACAREEQREQRSGRLSVLTSSGRQQKGFT